MKYPKKHYTEDEQAWCVEYQRETGFEALMCDYEAGNQQFVEAAYHSVAWFESWASGAYLKISHNIPGAMEELMQSVEAPNA